MFEIKTVREKLVKQWRRYDFHQRWLTDSLRFPLQVPLPKITDRQLLHRFVDLQGQVIQFRQACEGLPGIEIIEKEFNFSSMGRQRIPTAIVVMSLDDLCRFIGKKSHWDKFVNDVTLLRRFFPQIEPWFVGNIPLIEQYHGDWLRLIQVCRYFLATPRPGLYLRQLDIVGIDSKFIETHKRALRQLLDFLLPPECIDFRYSQLTNFGFERRYGLLHEGSVIRFRLLDPDLRRYFCGIRDLSVPVDEFAGLELPLDKVYITENKVNFLSFPSMNNAIVIFGQGYGVQLLKQVAWLNHVKICYWGDIDTNGFAILSQLRGYFSHVESLLMDEQTVLACREFWGDEPEHSCHSSELLPFLTEQEQKVYKRIKMGHWKKHLRVEQERIPFHLLQQALGINSDMK
ncbi:Wadjet anti-phage system protein JetD domain-containing protein [Salmonella enterica]